MKKSSLNSRVFCFFKRNHEFQSTKIQKNRVAIIFYFHISSLIMRKVKLIVCRLISSSNHMTSLAAASAHTLQDTAFARVARCLSIAVYIFTEKATCDGLIDKPTLIFTNLTKWCNMHCLSYLSVSTCTMYIIHTQYVRILLFSPGLCRYFQKRYNNMYVTIKLPIKKSYSFSPKHLTRRPILALKKLKNIR